MSKHPTNAANSVLDHTSYPVEMLLVAPIILHRLSASQSWMIAKVPEEA